MEETDYYKLLNVSKDASDQELKKAYRTLAMKYHPDKTKGDKSAEDQFKKINEAYAVLSDKKKRSQYDTYGSTGFQERYSQEDIFKGFDLGDIFKEFGFGGGGGSFHSSFGGNPFGGGGRNKRQQQQQIKGSNILYQLPLTLHEVYNGTSKTISYQTGDQSEQLTVKIPKGMITGKKLRLAGKGEASPYGGPRGDLFVESNILTDSIYVRDEYDLSINKHIKLSEALLGTNVSVPVLDGRTLNLKVPPGTQHKTKMRLTGMGLPHMKGNKKGNLYVYILTDIPKKLTDTQEKLIKELATEGL